MLQAREYCKGVFSLVPADCKGVLSLVPADGKGVLSLVPADCKSTFLHIVNLPCLHIVNLPWWIYYMTFQTFRIPTFQNFWQGGGPGVGD